MLTFQCAPKKNAQSGVPTLGRCNHPPHKPDNVPMGVPGTGCNHSKLLIGMKASERG